MSTGSAVKQGFSIARRVRAAVWVLFLVNLGLAAVAGLPIYRGVLIFTGHSLMGQTLASALSPDWLADFSSNMPGSLTRYASFILAFGLLSILVNAVLAGGVLGCFRDPGRKFSLTEFFDDTRRYAWSLFWLMMIGLVCYWIVFRLLNQGLGNLVDKWARDSLDDRPVFWAHLAVGVLVILGLALVNLVMDYARVKLVMDEGTGAVEAFLASLGFCLTRLRKALTIYAIPSLGGLAVLGIYLLGATRIRSLVQGAPLGRIGDPLTLSLFFIGQQAIMFVRYWFRVATWASEWSYLRNSK